VIRNYLSKISVPVVIDADAIHAIADSPEIISNKPFLVTPHGYEFSLLTGKEIKELSAGEKVKMVKEEAQRLGTTILFKGEIDIKILGHKGDLFCKFFPRILVYIASQILNRAGRRCFFSDRYIK